jgi:hypothetical protein
MGRVTHWLPIDLLAGDAFIEAPFSLLEVIMV